MNIKLKVSRTGARADHAFTVVEAMVCVGVFGVLFAAVFSAVSSSISVVSNARNTLRAAQIMTEKLDVIRLYGWDNLTNAGYLPTTFQVAFYPTNGLNAGTSTSQGTVFNGTMTLTNAPITTEDYAGDVKMVTVTLTWKRGLVTRQSQMSTLVSHYGMQSYSIF